MTSPVIQDPPRAEPDWEDELARVGFVRRMIRARRWYGADWWFVAISGVMVAFFIVLALFPGIFAPYSPTAQVGPRFLSPGEPPHVPLLVVPAGSTVASLEDLATGPDS